MRRWGCGVLGLGLIVAALAPAGLAEAANVLLLYSSRYTHLGANNGHPPEEQEADNVKAGLVALQHTVTTIAGPDDPVGNCGFLPPYDSATAPGTVLATADEYRTALAAADVLHIPEHSRFCSLAYDLAYNRPDGPEIASVWRTWVGQGGGLVIHVGFEGREKVPALLNLLFGFQLTAIAADGVTTTRTSAAAGTRFAAGPATLPGNVQSGHIALASLPPGSTSVYDDGTNASVAILRYGAGKIMVLAWDWAYSNPPFAGLQNGGWFPYVLSGAVQEALTREEPLPPSPSFDDVPPGHWARAHIQALAAAGVTAGCGGNNFCPDSPVTRAEMAVFLLRARHGAGFTPPPTGGVFADVPTSYWAAAWIERLAEEGIAAGCATDRYCPDAAVTRAQMAVFLVRATSAPGFVPLAATGVFSDVPTTYWAAAWIEQIARDGITAGCGGGLFCPESLVSRAQMAVFLVTAFDLGP